MRVWTYAFKEGFRALIVVEFALVISSAVVWVALAGLIAPPRQSWFELGKIAAICALIVFPAALLSKRYEVWRNNQVNPKQCSPKS